MRHFASRSLDVHTLVSRMKSFIEIEALKEYLSQCVDRHAFDASNVVVYNHVGPLTLVPTCDACRRVLQQYDTKEGR